MKLKKQPPRFPFLREPFEVQVALEDSHLSDYSKLNVFLVSAGQPVEGAQIVRYSTTADVCTLTVEIINSNLAHSRESAQLRVTYELESILSDPFDVILARVEITEKLSTTEDQRFYKDQGPKDKMISVNARVFDKHNRAPTTKIDWACTLLYSNFKLVEDQTILTHKFEEKDNGEFVLMYRIDQVSRAHRNQDFVVRLHADNDPTVSFDTTQPVTILSKLNRRSSAPPKKIPLPKKPPKKEAEQNSSFDSKPPVRAASSAAQVDRTEYVRLLKSMRDTLKQLEWQHCGFATSSMTGQVDMNRKIHRCQICNQYKRDPDHLTANSHADHAPSCTILQNLQQFDCLFGGSSSAVVVPGQPLPLPSPSPSFTSDPTCTLSGSFPSLPGTSLGLPVTSIGNSFTLNGIFDFIPEPMNSKKRTAENDLDWNDQVNSPQKVQRLGSWSLHVELDESSSIPQKISSMNSFNSVDFSSNQAPVDATNMNTQT